MEMDSPKDGQVSIRMIKYLCNILDDFIQDTKKSPATQSSDYLFKIRDKIKTAKLSQKLMVIFHHTKTQLCTAGSPISWTLGLH